MSWTVNRRRADPRVSGMMNDGERTTSAFQAEAEMGNKTC